VLRNRKIVVGVTGSVAIFKACELVSRLRKDDAEVMVVMTEAATRLAGPDLFRSLSGREVATEMFGSPVGSHPHIDLSVWADLIVVAPATGNLLGKVASGIADDLLSTLIMAARSPVLLAPAMNTQMWQSPVVRGNIEKLKGLGFRIVEGEAGWLACGEEGEGRMAEVPVLAEAIQDALTVAGDMKGLRVLITAGPTKEWVDQVRFISNRSSGRTGRALAEEAARRGAQVIYVTGPASVPPPEGVSAVHVVSAEDMKNAVLDTLPEVDVLVMAAAVADYTPEHKHGGKLKKRRERITISCIPTDDILALVRERRRENQVIVGFALEVQNEVAHAQEKLREKHLDLVVVNNPLASESGFGKDSVLAAILTPSASDGKLSEMTKSDLARDLFDRVLEIRGRGR
jgi:phosphopantothenoylcysteine decarboxylase/phosphopantothenate--cysteine ligase